jgi:GNAT superfamily N-acetyltransferase
VRPAQVGDAERIARLNGVVQALHVDERPDRFKQPDLDEVVAVVKEWLRAPERHIWLAEDEHSTPLGYAMGVRIDRPPNALVAAATVVELDQVVVVPEARGQGVATELCSRVLGWARDLAADRVEVSTWAFNTEAQSFFAHLGFTTDSLRLSRPVGS